MEKSAKVRSNIHAAPAFLTYSNPFLDDPKKLVVIQLSGGNDGLNTIVPYRNDVYYKSRTQLAINKKETFLINDELGFNKAFEGIHNLFNEGYVGVVNAMGYPNPNRSHFKSLDVWHSAGDSKKPLNTGWIGRFLDANCKDDKNRIFAVGLDDLLKLALKGEEEHGLAFENIDLLYKQLQTKSIKRTVKRFENRGPFENDNLDFIYSTILNGCASVGHINTKLKSSKISLSNFPKTTIGNELKSVANFILSDIETKIFYITHGSFDTHANQAGRQEKLLKQLSDAVYAFANTLKKHHKFEDCCIMIFSEFGRRVAENGSSGTDHGQGNSLYIINGNLKNAGMLNAYPDLLALDKGDVPYQIDFRSVYATILEDWFGCDSETVLHHCFEKLAIFKTT